MPKFKVCLAQEPTESGELIIEAEDADEAEEKAMIEDLPDDFAFAIDEGNDYTKSRYVAWVEPYVEPPKAPYVEPTPLSRARLVRPSIDAYAKACNESENDLDMQVGDFLGDLMHMCRIEDIDFNKMLARAVDHFNEEILEAQELENEAKKEWKPYSEMPPMDTPIQISVIGQQDPIDVVQTTPMAWLVGADGKRWDNQIILGWRLKNDE